MNQDKIGKFIASCRRNKKLTQETLAEKLDISNRAVSKWERGINLPDASLMLKLCDILDISVNELLTGDKISKENYKEKAELNLIKMKQMEEKNNRLLLKIETIIGFTCSIVFLIIILIASYISMNFIAKFILIITALILFIVGIFISIKLEKNVGYYECDKCHEKYIPETLSFYFSMHFGRTRYLKCPKCHKKGWHKKVLTK